jgi:macrolide phosphotransferase
MDRVSRRGSQPVAGYGGSVRHNSYSLAAFAAASVPGFEPARTVAIPTPQDDVDVAGVISQEGRKVLVTCPRTTAGGVRLEKELSIAGSLAKHALSDLVPSVLGSVKLPEGGRAAVTEVHEGAPLLLDLLDRDRDLVTSLGEVIARIHRLPAHVVETVGAEAYTAQALRESHRAQLARARELETIPTAVQQRWETLLADDGLWDFQPVVVHGDLSEESLFFRGSRITGVRGWDTARIGDPADDLAWLASALEAEAFDDLFSAYRNALGAPVHPRLLERAHAVGEFAVIDWLLHGIEAEDDVIIEDARSMLRDLESDLSQIAKDQAESAYHSLDVHDGLASAPSPLPASAPSAEETGTPVGTGSPVETGAPVGTESASPAPEDASAGSAPSAGSGAEDGAEQWDEPEGPVRRDDPSDGPFGGSRTS